MKFYNIFTVPIQVAIAMFFAYEIAALCSQVFTGEPPKLAALWAGISATLVVQASLKESIAVFKVRVFGSLLGSIGAILCFILMQVNAWSIAFSAVVIAVICAIFKFEQHMRLSCITLLLLLLIHQLSPDQPIYNFALWRLFDSILGSLVAICVVWVAGKVIALR